MAHSIGIAASISCWDWDIGVTCKLGRKRLLYLESSEVSVVAAVVNG